MQMRSHGATELISLHLQLGSSQTWGDQNTSNILRDNVPPVSGSPTSLALPQRAGGCLLAEKQDEARGGREGRACSLFLSLSRHSLLSVLGQCYLVELTAMMKVFCICTVQHSSSRRAGGVGHWKCEGNNRCPLGICSFK